MTDDNTAPTPTPTKSHGHCPTCGHDLTDRDEGKPKPTHPATMIGRP